MQVRDALNQLLRLRDHARGCSTPPHQGGRWPSAAWQPSPLLLIVRSRTVTLFLPPFQCTVPEPCRVKNGALVAPDSRPNSCCLSLKLTRVAYYRILRRVASRPCSSPSVRRHLIREALIYCLLELSYSLAAPRVGRLFQHLLRPLKCNKSATTNQNVVSDATPQRDHLPLLPELPEQNLQPG